MGSDKPIWIEKKAPKYGMLTVAEVGINKIFYSSYEIFLPFLKFQNVLIIASIMYIFTFPWRVKEKLKYYCRWFIILFWFSVSSIIVEMWCALFDSLLSSHECKFWRALTVYRASPVVYSYCWGIYSISKLKIWSCFPLIVEPFEFLKIRAYSSLNQFSLKSIKRRRSNG